MKKLFMILLILSLTFHISSISLKASEIFKDVPHGYWASDEISYISSLDIITGYGDGTFKPNNKINRKEAAIIIGRTLNINLDNRPQPLFKDVSQSDIAYPYIAALTDEGIFNNVSHFNPSSYLTREQLAKVLVEAFHLTGKINKTFKDVPPGSWAFPYVNTLTATGITAGVSDHNYAPSQSVTRAQMVVFIDRTLKHKITSTNAEEILRLTNIERALAGVPPLQLSLEAQPVANLKAQDMAENAYFSHTSPTYGSPFDMLNSFRVSYSRAGENLFAGSQEPSTAISSWMNSKGHRENILNPSFTHMGVGYSEGGPYGHYWVQIFIK